MHKNQKIQVQSATDVRLPPKTGPMLGAVVTLIAVSGFDISLRVNGRTRMIPKQQKSLSQQEMQYQRQHHMLSRTCLAMLEDA